MICHAHRLPLPAPDLGPAFLVALVLLVIVLLRRYRPIQPDRGRRLRPLAQDRPAARDAPGGVRQARPRRLPRPLDGDARDQDRQHRRRPAAVPAHRRTGHPAGADGAGPGHDRRPDPDRLHDASSWPVPACGSSCCSSRPGSPPWATSSSATLPAVPRRRPSSIPGPTPRATASTPSRACFALALGGLVGHGLGQSRSAGGLYLPQRSQRLHLRRHRRGAGLLGAARRHRPLHPAVRLPGHPHRARRARHLRRPAGRRHHCLAGAPGVHQHRRGRRSCCPSRASRCRS